MTAGALVWLMAAAAAQEPPLDAGSRAFVETVAPDSPCYAQQVVALGVRFGIESEFLANNLIQPFRLQLDVPVQLDAPWLDELAGAERLDQPIDRSRSADRATVAVNGAVATARRAGSRAVGGRRFAVFEIATRFVLARSGELVVAAPRLRLAYATEFRDDLIVGRAPADHHDAVVAGASRTVPVLDLPAAGRPAAFAGAVGSFTVRAAAQPTEMTVGDGFELTLHVEGDGNLAGFAPPSLPVGDDFHVRGRREAATPSSRTIVWDLVPRHAGATRVPAVTFAFFEPRPPAGYRTVATEPIDLTVRPAPDATAGAGRGSATPGVDDINDLLPASRARGDGGQPLPAAVLILGLAAPWLLAGLAWSWRRARKRAAGDPQRQRELAAAADFRAARSGGTEDVAGLLVAYLAARLRSSPTRVVAPQLPEMLAAAGIASDLAERTAALLERLAAARYGGTVEPGAAGDADAIVEELERSFARRDGAR